MKIYLCLLLLLCQPLLLSAKSGDEFDPGKKITADSARRSIRELMNEMAKKHPGFYRYTSQKELDHFIDSSLTAINDSVDVLGYYRLLKPLIAKVRCVHTNLTLPDNCLDFLNAQANMLPLDLYFKGDKAYIVKNYSGNQDIPIGAEIISINGHSITGIKERLFSMISTDGFNQTWKYQAINHRFAQVYRNNYETSPTFKVVVATKAGNREWVLPAVKDADIPVPVEMQMGSQQRLDFTIQDSVAILSIRSFGETDIKAGGQQYRKFLSAVFEELRKQQTRKLVIDLRNNTGGSDPNAVLLCRYLIDRPFRYWDRIEVTEPFASSLKGSAKLVYGKPIKKDSVYLWQKSKFTHEFDFYQEQQPQSGVFTGKLILLVNGACLSSCADVAAVLQYNKRATIIGEETGGGYQGNNSGLIPEATLSFGLKVSVPLLKYINAVDPAKNYGQGTYPDVIYDPGIEQVLQGEDGAMKIAIQQFEN